MAWPEIVSAGEANLFVSFTLTPAGHHGGKSKSVESDWCSTSIAAHPRPFGARGTRALSTGDPCPAICQSSAGVHEPNAKPKH